MYKHKCAMHKDFLPECCAQWRFGGECANTGGTCPYRVREKIGKATERTADKWQVKKRYVARVASGW